MAAPLFLTACLGTSATSHRGHNLQDSRDDAVRFINEDRFDLLRRSVPLRVLDSFNSTAEDSYSAQGGKTTGNVLALSQARFHLNRAWILRQYGRCDQAREKVLLAIALLEPQVQKASHPYAWQSLGEAYGELRDLRDGLDPGVVLHHAQEAIRCFSQANAQTNGGAVTRLAHAHFELGDIFREQKRLPEAVGEVDLAVDILDRMSPNQTNAMAVQIERALMFYYQGLIQYDQGATDQAQGNLLAYLVRIQQLSDQPDHAADRQLQHHLAEAQGHLGRVLLDHGEVAEALNHFQEYQRLADALERFDPENVYYQRELGFSLEWLALALEKNGGVGDRSLDLLARARACFQKLEIDFPQSELWPEHAARSLTRLAEWYSRHQRPEEARRLLTGEAEHRWTLLAHGGTRPGNHLRFIRALEWSESQLGISGEAAADREARLRDWVRRVAAESSKPSAGLSWKRTEVVVRRQLSNVLTGNQDFEGAERELQQTLPLWLNLSAGNPQDAEAAVSVARTFYSINTANRRTGKTGQELNSVALFVEWLKSRPQPELRPVLEIAQRWLADLERLENPLAPGQADVLHEFQHWIERLESTD